jgi:RNA-directed DNA polymerase
MSDYVVDFSRVNTVPALARAMGCSDALVLDTIEFNRRPVPERPPDGQIITLGVPEGLHQEVELPKKNRRRKGETRTVLVVRNVALASTLKALARRLELYLRSRLATFPPTAVYGFISGGSTYRNAARHLGARLLVNADIRDFFPTISTARVVESLRSSGFSQQGAELMGDFVTVRGSLPLGFSTSPLLSNLVCTSLDIQLELLAKECGCTYTRYADDLAFSGSERVPNREEIRGALAAEGFQLADAKFRASRRGQRQFVTGLSIADERQPRVPKAFKRRLRQELHACARYGIEDHANWRDEQLAELMNSIDGRIGYLQGIEPALGSKLRCQWRDLLKRDGRSVAYPRTEKLASSVTVLVDESEWKTADDLSYFGVACVIIEDPASLRAAIHALARERLEDPFYGGRHEPFQRKGFHFTDDPPRANDDFCKLLAAHPIRTFLAFCLRGAEPFQEVYLRLFRWLVRQRLMAADGASLHLICDGHEELGESHLTNELVEIMLKLATNDMRRPTAIDRVRCPAKAEEPLLAVPDYMLGVFGQYASSPTMDPLRMQVRRFEQLRDKYRLIQNFDKHESFNRQRVFQPLQFQAPRAP